MKHNHQTKKMRKAKTAGKLRLAAKPVRKLQGMIPLPAAWES
jgi:hypothetical protein